MTWIVLWVLIGVIATNLVVQGIFIAKILPIFENRPPFGVELSPSDPDAELLTIPSTNGLKLRGSFYRAATESARGLVVFAPEMGGNHWSAMSYGQALLDAGFHVLSFDFRNQGESDHMPGYQPLHWLSDYEVADLKAVLRYVRQRDDLRGLPIGLFGISRGGCAVLAVGAVNADVKAVACEGVSTTRSMLFHYTLRWASLYIPGWLMNVTPLWHVRLTLEMARIVSQRRLGRRFTILERFLPRLRNRPVLVIADGRDTYVPSEIAEHVGECIGGDECEVWIVPDARHNGARTVDRENYDRRLVEVFSEMAVSSPSTAT